MGFETERTSLTVGLKKVRKAVSQHKAKKVYIAKDCDVFLLESLETLCKDSGVDFEYAESMKDLGRECGIDVSASCACIC